MMENDVLKIILRRRSVRHFTAEQISEHALRAVLDAGCCAPYANKPAHITVLQNADLIAKLNTAAKEAARHMGMPHLEALGANPDFIGSYSAPTLVIVSDEEDSVAPALNCGAAAENMLIAAEALGLGACWVHFPLFFLYGPQAAEISAQLKLPQGTKPYACLALGHKAADATFGERAYSVITYIK